MSVSIVRGTNDKPVSSQTLVECFSKYVDLSGELFIGYPIISTPEGRHPIDALWVSPSKGLVIFDLIEGSYPSNYQERQDDLANRLEARLRTHRELTKRRILIVPIQTISFAPAMYRPASHHDDDYLLADSSSLEEKITQIEEWENSDKDVYRNVLSAIQNISTIRKKRTMRPETRSDSRGAKLKRLEDSIATLDHQQSRAVIETVGGVQRIRGLAGSGKTIVLALKAVYLHAQHPDWRIAVTFHTRSLKGQFRYLINNFFIRQTGEEPDWNNLRILNAWGAPGGDDRDGIYYEFCRTLDIEYFDFEAIRRSFGRGREFYKVCKYALKQTHASKAIYNAILVDEAQDLPPEFLQICYQLLDDPKLLVYAYDELQNLAGESLPPPEEIFGHQTDGSPKVRFDSDINDERHDIILDVCYRNSRPLLVTAHALGFGIYRYAEKANATGLVQMFDYPQLWEDIGYQVKGGELNSGSYVTLQRTDKTSPEFLEKHSLIGDLIQFICFEDEQEQSNWLVHEIKKNLEKDELLHDDIIVINPDPLTTREKVGPIRNQLLRMGIDCHLAGVDTDPDTFFQSNLRSVTFTGIFRAKGNEAGMVYIINAQDCQAAGLNLASIRNRLFTAITRSKAWVRVLGVGNNMIKLKEEYEKLRSQNFELKFVYPTDEERQHLRVIHRDMTEQERKKIKRKDQALLDLVSDLASGKIHKEDLNEQARIKLRELLSEDA